MKRLSRSTWRSSALSSSVAHAAPRQPGPQPRHGCGALAGRVIVVVADLAQVGDGRGLGLVVRKVLAAHPAVPPSDDPLPGPLGVQAGLTRRVEQRPGQRPDRPQPMPASSRTAGVWSRWPRRGSRQALRSRAVRRRPFDDWGAVGDPGFA